MDGGAMRIKVPVAAAIVAAWRSVFGRLGLVLELGWLLRCRRASMPLDAGQD